MCRQQPAVSIFRCSSNWTEGFIDYAALLSMFGLEQHKQCEIHYIIKEFYEVQMHAIVRILRNMYTGIRFRVCVSEQHQSLLRCMYSCGLIHRLCVYTYLHPDPASYALKPHNHRQQTVVVQLSVDRVRHVPQSRNAALLSNSCCAFYNVAHVANGQSLLCWSVHFSSATR